MPSRQEQFTSPEQTPDIGAILELVSDGYSEMKQEAANVDGELGMRAAAQSAQFEAAAVEAGEIDLGEPEDLKPVKNEWAKAWQDRLANRPDQLAA